MLSGNIKSMFIVLYRCFSEVLNVSLVLKQENFSDGRDGFSKNKK